MLRKLADTFVRMFGQKGSKCPICGKTIKRTVLRKNTYYVVHTDETECIIANITETKGDK